MALKPLPTFRLLPLPHRHLRCFSSSSPKAFLQPALIRSTVRPLAATTATRTPSFLQRPTAAAAMSTSESGSSGPARHEFLCIMPDKEGVQELRLKIRPLHFAGLKKLVEDGFLTWGGAMLNNVPAGDGTLDFKGSALTALATSKEELLQKLNEDPYAVHGVWDMEKAQVIPFACALREPLKK